MDTRRSWFQQIIAALAIAPAAPQLLANALAKPQTDIAPIKTSAIEPRPVALHEVEFYEASKPGMACNPLFLRLTLDDRIDKGSWVTREPFVTVAFHLEPNGFHQCWKPVHKAVPGMAIACRTAEVVIDRVHMMARDTFGSYYPCEI